MRNTYFGFARFRKVLPIDFRKDSQLEVRKSWFFAVGTLLMTVR